MKKVICEQFNVNDDSYEIMECCIESGQSVKKNDLLMVLDSSKATISIESEYSGYVYINKEINHKINVGEILYIISENKLSDDEEIASFKESDTPAKTNRHDIDELSQGNIITKKANEIILKNNIDSAIFKQDIVTERDVLQYLASQENNVTVKKSPNYNKIIKLALIGAGRGLEQILDIILLNSNLIPEIAYDDTDSLMNKYVGGVKVIEKVNFEKIRKDYEKGLFDAVVITVSTSIAFREKVFNELTKFSIPFENIIHPSVNIGSNVHIGSGNVIFANCCLSTLSEIGDNNFISAYTNIEHHNKLGSHNTFGPGVMTSGNVVIGNSNKFGTGIFIEPNIKIGNSNIFASGTLLTSNVRDMVLIYSDKVNKTKPLK